MLQRFVPLCEPISQIYGLSEKSIVLSTFVKVLCSLKWLTMKVVHGGFIHILHNYLQAVPHPLLDPCFMWFIVFAYNVVLFQDGQSMLWDLNEGKHLYTLEGGDIINALCFSPNRYWLCAAAGPCIKIWVRATIFWE